MSKRIVRVDFQGSDVGPATRQFSTRKNDAFGSPRDLTLTDNLVRLHSQTAFPCPAIRAESVLFARCPRTVLVQLLEK